MTLSFSISRVSHRYGETCGVSQTDYTDTDVINTITISVMSWVFTVFFSDGLNYYYYYLFIYHTTLREGITTLQKTLYFLVCTQTIWSPPLIITALSLSLLSCYYAFFHTHTYIYIYYWVLSLVIIYSL